MDGLRLLFLLILESGKIYGRGAIDDKGPVISSLYAMKAIKDNLKINSRVRLILGVNEEKDWKCINYYKEHAESPTVGFSPDANFPCIYAEKGIATIFIKEDYEKYKNLPIQIKKIDCANNAINVVPKYCSVNLNLNLEKISMENVCNVLVKIIQDKNLDISYTSSNSEICLTAQGVQAHAAHPELGKNAISQMLILLSDLYTNFDINLSILKFFKTRIGMEYNGKTLGTSISDESGALTLNVGKFEFSENNIQIGLNLRIPVNTSIDSVLNQIKNTCITYNLESFIAGRQEPLYVPKEDPLIKTLCSIYNKYTNSNLSPIPIGGGTYARAFKNCVSFGANFPGDIDMCHQANEFVDINKLILACKIYADAILKLS